MLNSKPIGYQTTLLLLALGLVACEKQSVTQHIGKMTLCLPKVAMLNHSDDSSNDQVVVDALSIEQDIPSYLDGLVFDKEQPYTRPKIYISDYGSTQIPQAKEHEYDPNFLEGQSDLKSYKSEGDSRFLVYWNIFVMQPNQSKSYWGECAHKNFDPYAPIECNRQLKLNGLTLTYPIAQTNIDLYPEIDAYLKQKVTEEWRCDQ